MSVCHLDMTFHFNKINQRDIMTYNLCLILIGINYDLIVLETLNRKIK